MTLGAPVVLAAAEFDDDDLVLAALRDDLGLDGSNERRKPSGASLWGGGIRQNLCMSLVKPNPEAPSLDTLRALVGDDWPDVNRMIVRRLGSDVALVNQVAHHIIHNLSLIHI